MTGAFEVTFSVERATVSDDGLGTTRTWAAGGTIVGRLLPASRSLLERAELLGVRATHAALFPNGFVVSPADTRLKVGTTVYDVRDAQSHPRGVTVILEVSP